MSSAKYPVAVQENSDEALIGLVAASLYTTLKTLWPEGTPALLKFRVDAHNRSLEEPPTCAVDFDEADNELYVLSLANREFGGSKERIKDIFSTIFMQVALWKLEYEGLLTYNADGGEVWKGEDVSGIEDAHQLPFMKDVVLPWMAQATLDFFVELDEAMAPILGGPSKMNREQRRANEKAQRRIPAKGKAYKLRGK